MSQKDWLQDQLDAASDKAKPRSAASYAILRTWLGENELERVVQLVGNGVENVVAVVLVEPSVDVTPQVEVPAEPVEPLPPLPDACFADVEVVPEKPTAKRHSLPRVPRLHSARDPLRDPSKQPDEPGRWGWVTPLRGDGGRWHDFDRGHPEGSVSFVEPEPKKSR